MSNITNDLWKAFEEEVGEQLDQLDLELLKGTSGCDLHRIFRDFHTIKSSCAMLDMTSMKELAHVSEDYLDMVRKGQVSLSDDAIDILLSAVERLKSQLLFAVTSRQNPEAAHDEIRDIRKLLGRPGAVTIAASAEVQTSSEIDELAKVSISALFELSQSETLTPALKKKLVDFGNVAELLDYPVIQTLTRDLLIQLRDTTDTSNSPLRILEAELLDRVKLLEMLHGVDLGSAQAHINWRVLLRKDYLSLVIMLADIFSELEHGDTGEWSINRSVETETLIQQLIIHSTLCGFDELSNLFRYISQVIRGIKRKYFEATKTTTHALRSSIDHSYSALLDEGEDNFRHEIIAARQKIELSFQATVASEQSYPNETAAASAVDDRFLGRLNQQNTNELENELRAGNTLYEINLDMRQESNTVELLLSWISSEGTILHNISSFEDNTTDSSATGAHIVFLVAFDMPLDEIRENLLKIDPAEQLFTIQEHIVAADNNAAQKNDTVLPAVDEKSETTRILNATLRIDSKAVDNLVAQVGEVIMVRNMITSLSSKEKHDLLVKRCRTILDKERKNQASSPEMAELREKMAELISIRDRFQQADSRMQSAIGQVQMRILDLREMPLSMVLNRLPNIVRKKSHALGKTIELKISGHDVRIDKGMIDLLMKSLTTLLGFIIDKSIEVESVRERLGKLPCARIVVDARMDNDFLQIRFEDDGAGNSKIADLADLKATLDRIGGQMLLENIVGKASIFVLQFPRSVAMQTVLLVRSNIANTAIPERNIIEIVRLSPDAVQILQGRASCSWRGEVIPLATVGEWLNGDDHCVENFYGNTLKLIVVRSGLNKVGICVDQILGLHDAYIPEAHLSMKPVSHINGTTVMGDGSVVFILNVEHLTDRLYQALHLLFQHSQNGDRAA